MHIAMVIDRLDVGGAERVALTLSESFLDQGHDISFITIDNIKTIDIDPRIALYSLSFEDRFNRYHYNQKKMSTLLDSIQQESTSFDFILVHLYKASRVMQHYTKVPCFHIMHSTQSKSALKEKTGFKRHLAKRKIQNVYNGLNIISVSKGVETDLLNIMKVKPKSSHVIYNPFPIQKIKYKAQETFILPFDDDYIIYVGRLVKEKRVDYLLEAFQKSNITEQLLILGDGGEKESLMILAKELNIQNHVTFLGAVSNPYKYIKRAKFLVLSSHHEGFGNVLVEALLLQTPVASTNCPSGPKEILEHYTLDALVEDNFDNDALAEKLQQWSINALPVKEHSMNIFSDRVITQQYIELYKTINKAIS